METLFQTGPSNGRYLIYLSRDGVVIYLFIVDSNKSWNNDRVYTLRHDHEQSFANPNFRFNVIESS